jgi:hypothetical protein
MSLSADDRLAIVDTLSRYNQAIDNFLPEAADAWADCFTQDGIFRAVTRSGARARDRLPSGMWQPAKPGDSEQTDPEALISLLGREQLRAFAVAAHATHATRRQPGYHWVSNVLIEGKDELATMTCYLRVMAGKTDELNEAATATGFYRDQLSKVNGRWGFKSRFIMFDD